MSLMKLLLKPFMAPRLALATEGGRFNTVFGPQNEIFGKQENEESDILSKAIDFMNRNARAPKRANHGARPCSHVMRRLKKKKQYRKWRENGGDEEEFQKLDEQEPEEDIVA